MHKSTPIRTIKMDQKTMKNKLYQNQTELNKKEVKRKISQVSPSYGTKKAKKTLKKIWEIQKIERTLNLKMEMFIEDNGKGKSNMVLEH